MHEYTTDPNILLTHEQRNKFTEPTRASVALLHQIEVTDALCHVKDGSRLSVL